MVNNVQIYLPTEVSILQIIYPIRILIIEEELFRSDISFKIQVNAAYYMQYGTSYGPWSRVGGDSHIKGMGVLVVPTCNRG